MHAPRAYRPRKPRATALYQCAVRHASELKAGGRFERHVEENVVARFVACGDPRHGFARIYCDQCRHSCILAFSCKAESRWQCNPGCQHELNTFWTAGVCPGCAKAWMTTVCPSCHVRSLHKDWYHFPDDDEEVVKEEITEKADA